MIIIPLTQRNLKTEGRVSRHSKEFPSTIVIWGQVARVAWKVLDQVFCRAGPCAWKFVCRQGEHRLE